MPQNLGSFGAGLGQGAQNPLAAAIAARQGQGAPVPQLNQTTPASAQGQSPQAPPVPSGAPSGMPMPQGMAGGTPPSTEAELIVKGLTDRLKAISKVEQQPLAAPVGGGGY